MQFFLVNAGTQISPAVVGIKTVSYMDTKRQRPLLMDLYYPVIEGTAGEEPQGPMVQAPQARNAIICHPEHHRLPLIILCHGYGGSRIHLSWFAEFLAKKGYIVAALEIYGNSESYDTPIVALKRCVRPLDVKAALDKLLHDPKWSKDIDPHRIGFAGFSLGGLAGIWLAGGIADKFEVPNMKTSGMYDLAKGAQQSDIDCIDYKESKLSYKDKRIKAFFLMAPAVGKAFSKNALQSVKLPIQIIIGEADTMTPVKENAQHFANHLPNAKLTIIPGNAEHLTFRNKIKDSSKSCVSPGEFDLRSDSPIDQVHGQTSDLALQFFNEQLK
jgi:predicted dienelactone hydrolase